MQETEDLFDMLMEHKSNIYSPIHAPPPINLLLP